MMHPQSTNVFEFWENLKLKNLHNKVNKLLRKVNNQTKLKKSGKF